MTVLAVIILELQSWKGPYGSSQEAGDAKDLNPKSLWQSSTTKGVRQEQRPLSCGGVLHPIEEHSQPRCQGHRA